MSGGDIAMAYAGGFTSDAESKSIRDEWARRQEQTKDDNRRADERNKAAFVAGAIVTGLLALMWSLFCLAFGAR